MADLSGLLQKAEVLGLRRVPLPPPWFSPAQLGLTSSQFRRIYCNDTIDTAVSQVLKLGRLQIPKDCPRKSSFQIRVTRLGNVVTVKPANFAPGWNSENQPFNVTLQLPLFFWHRYDSWIPMERRKKAAHARHVFTCEKSFLIRINQNHKPVNEASWLELHKRGRVPPMDQQHFVHLVFYWQQIHKRFPYF